MESPSHHHHHHHHSTPHNSNSSNNNNSNFDFNVDTTFILTFTFIFVSFLLFRRPLLTQIYRTLFNSGTSETSSTSTIHLSPQSRSSGSNNTNNNNNSTSTTNNEPINQPDEASSPPSVTVPFEEVFSPDIQNLSKINFILSEQVYHRNFNSTTIIKVLDLKKYFFPNEFENGKRIIFIHNGRALIDTEQLTNITHFLNGENPPFIHCMIKNPLTADQVTNDPNYSTESTSAFTWMCTKTLYILTGLFLVILWSLKVTSPKLFNFFSTIMLLVFTLFWAFGFYSSLKTNSSISTSVNSNAHNFAN